MKKEAQLSKEGEFATRLSFKVSISRLPQLRSLVNLGPAGVSTMALVFMVLMLTLAIATMLKNFLAGKKVDKRRQELKEESARSSVMTVNALMIQKLCVELNPRLMKRLFNVKECGGGSQLHLFFLIIFFV